MSGARWALAVILVLGGRAGAQDAPTNGGFGMTDDEFWTQPEKGFNQLTMQAVASKAPSFVIDAPKVVDLGARTSLPVPIFYAMPGGAKLVRDATVIVSRLEDRACWAAAARRAQGEDDESGPDQAERPSGGPPPPPGKVSAQSLVTDLRQTPLIPWEPGTYEVRVVVRDRSSNVVRTVLKGAGAPPAAKGPPAASPAPGSPLPGYAKRDDSPALPAGPGIAFEVPAEVAAGATQALLRVSFRLPVLRGDRTGDAAFVPLHLVLVGAEDGESLLLRLRIPVTGFDPAAEAPLATGHATLDLLQLHRPLAGGQTRTFLVRAISGDVVAGPTPMKLVR